MRLITALVAAVLLMVAVDLYPTEADQKSVVAAMQERRQAESKGDAERWDTLVANDCVWVEPSGRIKQVADHRPRANAGVKLSREVNISETAAREYGDLAILTYREDVRTKVAEKEVKTSVRFTETYRKVKNEWVLVHSAETPILERTGVQVSTARFSDFVGEYEMAPEMIGIVEWDGKTLTLFSKGWKQPYQLVPLTENRFFVREFETTEITFVRDASGKVTHQTSESPNQPVLTAKKIK